MGLIAYSQNDNGRFFGSILTTAFNTATQQFVTPNKSNNSVSAARVLSGFKNPNFRDQIAQGINATTPMTASEVSVVSVQPFVGLCSTLGSLINVRTVDTTDMVADMATGQSPVTSLSTTVNERCLSRFYSNASSVNSFTILGELKETVDMIRHPALALREGLSGYLKKAKSLRDAAVRRYPGSSRSARRMFADSVAGTWLEYNFGWKPLQNDIKDLLKAYNSMLSGPPNEVITAFVSLDGTRDEVYRTNVTIGFISDLISRTESRFSSGCQIKAGVKTGLGTDAGVVSNFGLYPENFIPAAWELCPWSFLIDYFTTVGSVLDSWATARRLGFAWVSITSRNETIRTYSRTLSSKPSNPNMSMESPGKLVVRSKTVSRSTPSSVPLPSLRLDIKLSTSRGLNIAALSQLKAIDLKFRF